MTTTHTQVQGLITPGASEREETVCVDYKRRTYSYLAFDVPGCCNTLYAAFFSLWPQIRGRPAQNVSLLLFKLMCNSPANVCVAGCCQKKVQFPAIEQKYKLLAEKADRKDVFMIIDNARKRRQTHAQAHTVTKTPIWRQGKYLPRPEERWNEGRQWEHRQNTGKKQSEQLVQCAAAAVICRLTASRKKGTINLMLVPFTSLEKWRVIGRTGVKEEEKVSWVILPAHSITPKHTCLMSQSVAMSSARWDRLVWAPGI